MTAALGSGLPGLFALRLAGAGPYQLPPLVLLPFQEIRIICTNVGAITSAAITLGPDASLNIAGTVGTVEIQGLVTLDAGAVVTVGGTVGLALFAALLPLLTHEGDGTVSFEGGGVTVLSDTGATAGTVTGQLPGTVTLELTGPVAAGGCTQVSDGSDLPAFVATLYCHPLWTVNSGPCVASGLCVSRGSYGNNEHCVITAGISGTLASCPSFNTEACCDHVTIDGRCILGQELPGRHRRHGDIMTSRRVRRSRGARTAVGERAAGRFASEGLLDEFVLGQPWHA